MTFVILAKFKMTFAENHILFVHIFDPWKIRNETKMFHFPVTLRRKQFEFSCQKSISEFVGVILHRSQSNPNAPNIAKI